MVGGKDRDLETVDRVWTKTEQQLSLWFLPLLGSLPQNEGPATHRQVMRIASDLQVMSHRLEIVLYTYADRAGSDRTSFLSESVGLEASKGQETGLVRRPMLDGYS